jgi:putative endopeptidase
MKKVFNIFLLTMTMGMLIFSSCKQSQTVQNEFLPAIDTSNMDLNVNPGEDFFLYANGGWIKKNPIPDEYSQYGTFHELINRNKEYIQELIDEAIAVENPEKGTPTQQIKDFYLSGMDTIAIQNAGISHLDDYFEAIENAATKDDIVDLIIEAHTRASFAAFVVYPDQDKKNSDIVIANVYQAGIGLPDRDYYLSDDPRSTEMRAEYVSHITKMFVLTGVESTKAESDANSILEFETRLAKASLSRKDSRDPFLTYNKHTVAELQEKTPNLNWTKYFEAFGINPDMELNVAMPDFIREVNTMIVDESIDMWKTYLKWNVLNEYAGYLSPEFDKQNFAFYGTYLRGQKKQKERWKRLVSATNGSIGDPVGKLFVETYFPPEAKTRMLELVGNLKVALGKHIEELDWMSDETKIQAKEKLDVMNLKIGYPDNWKDFSSLEITPDSYVKNIIACNKFNWKMKMDEINKPVDKSKWLMNPQIVNAYYKPNLNEIVFPAAILQPPYFNLVADDAVNYGAIGVVIGHEMTHGFDDKGSLFDKEGNLNNWWTSEDSTNFVAKTKVLVDQYNNYIMLDSLHVDGELTLGENIADLAGVMLSLDAYKMTEEYKQNKMIDGFTPLQRFFISYGKVWRQNIRDEELMNRIKTDVHSPGEARINGIVYNVPEFYEAFNLDENSIRYIPTAERAKVW